MGLNGVDVNIDVSPHESNKRTTSLNSVWGCLNKSNGAHAQAFSGSTQKLFFFLKVSSFSTNYHSSLA